MKFYNDHHPELIISRTGDAIERVRSRSTDASLIAGGDGVEIIHHRLQKDKDWYIGPCEDWTGFEYIVVLSGQLKCSSDGLTTILKAGDSASVQSVAQYITFTATTDTEFLYVSSQPVFHNYSLLFEELGGLVLTVEEKDGSTSEHCFRIRDMALLIGKHLQLPPRVIYELHYGAFFHDIGKAKIPDDILGKPGKLTPEEYEIMKLHTIFGKEMLSRSRIPVLRNIGGIVQQHHERYDGSGYPYGLKGDEININAAIIAVVDSYDAMVSDRIYRKARDRKFALQEIVQNRGILYHPQVVDSFIEILDDIDKVYQASSEGEISK